MPILKNPTHIIKPHAKYVEEGLEKIYITEKFQIYLWHNWKKIKNSIFFNIISPAKPSRNMIKILKSNLSGLDNASNKNTLTHYH